MGDAWDDDDFVPPPAIVAPTGNWDDEDVDVKPKASWDEGDTPKPAKTVQAPQKKTEKKPPEKKTAATKPEEPLDPIAEKARKQKLVEEADYQNAEDLFSGIGEKRSEKDESIDINTFQPSSEAEFERYANAIAKKLATHESSGLYVSFLKSLIRQLCTPLPRVEDCKEIGAVVNVVVNDKLKAEKEKTKPKKKGGGATSGKKANVKDAFDYDGGAYDDGDDDFM